MTNQTRPIPASVHQPAAPCASRGSSKQRLRATLLVVGMAVAMLPANAVPAAVQNPVASLIVGPALGVAMIALYVWVGRRVEKRQVAEFSRSGAGRHVVWGIALGTGLAVATIGILAIFGAYRITGWGSIAGVLTVVGMMSAVAVAEEIFFRGVVFRLLNDRCGALIALAASSALFGLLHLLNPSASIGGALAITIEAGLMLGAAYLLTGSLWLAIGVHFGWNVAIGGIFGTVVSGSGERDALVTATTSGPDWLSGGSFGPEASIVAVIVCSIATAAFLMAARRRTAQHR